MLDDRSWRWLVRYLANECNAQEKRSIEKWIASDARIKKELTNLKKIWDSSFEKKEEWDTDSAWERFKKYDARFSGLTNYQYTKKKYKRLRNAPAGRSLSTPRMVNFYKWATVISIITVSIFISATFFKPNQNTSVPVKPVMQVVTAHKGERVHLVLADGTKILLNGDSKLKIPQHFSDSTREVYLKGEAYFEVAHQPGKPFLVHAGHTVTRDLSTRFVVRSYPESGRTRVIVSEGKVAMHEAGIANVDHVNQRPAAIISADHIGIMKKDGSIQVTRVRNLMYWMGWTEGKLVFNNTSLHQVIKKLDRWYDLNITLKDSTITNRRLTATFFESQPMHEVLDAVVLSLDLKYTVKNRSVVLYRNK